jgi:hypothetical protein
VRREAGEHLFHRLLAADLNDTRATAAREAKQQIGNLQST